MTGNELLAHRITELESDLQAVARKTDRLLWALVSLSLSITTAAVVMSLTFVSARGR